MLAQALTAIEGRRLVEIGGDALEPGQKDHHVVAEALPEGHEHHRRQGQQRRGEETDGIEAAAQQGGEPAVYQAVFGIDPAKGNGRHHDRHQHRGVQSTAKPMDPRQLAVDQHGQGQGADHDRGHHSQQIQKGGACDPEKHRVGQQAPDIGQANEAQRLADIEAGLTEAHHQCHRCRNQHRQPDQHQGRGQKAPGRGGALAEIGLAHARQSTWARG